MRVTKSAYLTLDMIQKINEIRGAISFNKILEDALTDYLNKYKLQQTTLKNFENGSAYPAIDTDIEKWKDFIDSLQLSQARDLEAYLSAITFNISKKINHGTCRVIFR